MSIKALALAVLQGNSQGNQRENKSFLVENIGKQHGSVRKLQPDQTGREIVDQLPEWQADFCSACSDFNNWRGQCPVILDDCLIGKVIESDGNLNKLRGLNLGHGITTDAVIDLWLATGEPATALINDPAWLVCMAEHLVAAHQI